MDPLLIQLAIGLAVEGLAGLLSRSASELSDDLVGFDGVITDAIERVDDVPAIDAALGGERLRPFLRSLEVVALVRRVYAGQMSEADAPLDALRAEFIDLWTFHLGSRGADATDERVGRLFDVILAACDGALEAATQAGHVGALDARASRRQRLLLDKLDLVHTSIEAMRIGEVSPADIEAFRDRYQQLVRQREGTIVPPNFDSAPKVPINDLYVESRLQSVEETEHYVQRRLGYTDLIDDRGCKVVLGNPGSGKSTLTKKLATDYASLESDGKQPPIPFRIVLRDYGARKKEVACSIREFIESRVRADYQLNPPRGAIEYLLSAGAAVVIFDGLDELLETSYRREISADIESFTTVYPSVPLLVTSREVGYSQAPLDESLFDTYRLASFNDPQTREYVTKWFAREPRLSPAERIQQVHSFMAESESVTDLRSNPLMLALMCTIYRGEGYIPQNRPDVYERCAVLLFDRWDRQRQINVPLKIASHVKPAMQYLAHWIFTDAGVEAEVPESDIVTKAAEYLLEKRYEDPADAEEEAKRFVEFCTGRAWVFTDVGTTSGGERLYNFTHPTFLEYFAAGHLARTNADPAALNEILIPHIEEREWDVVAQLAYQMLDRNVDGGGETLLGELIPPEVDFDSKGQLSRVSFAARTLEFLVPPPATIRRIVTHAVGAALRWIDVRDLIAQPVDEPPGRDSPVAIVRSLESVSQENLDVMQETLETTLIETIRGEEGDRSLAAAELGLMLGAALPAEFDRTVIAETGPQLKAMAHTDRPIAIELVARGIVDLGRFVSTYGVSGIFEPCGYRIQPRSSRPALAGRMVVAAVLPAGRRKHWPPRTTPSVARAFLKSLAPILLEHPPPWYQIENVVHIGLMSPFEESSGEARRDFAVDDLDADEWFSVAAILAALQDEADVHSSQWVQGERPPGPLSPEFDTIAPTLTARNDADMEEKARQVEDERGFSSDQQALLQAWRANGVEFLTVPNQYPG